MWHDYLHCCSNQLGCCNCHSDIDIGHSDTGCGFGVYSDSGEWSDDESVGTDSEPEYSDIGSDTAGCHEYWYGFGVDHIVAGGGGTDIGIPTQHAGDRSTKD